jgi:hypothetical protein
VGACASGSRSSCNRLWRAAGKRRDGTDELRSVYETFTEGFDTVDLVEARGVLDDVDAPVV